MVITLVDTCTHYVWQSASFIHGALHGLVKIDLSGTRVTDDGLQLVLGAGEVLRYLGLRDLPGLTDRGLAAVLQCMKKRKRLRELFLCRSLRFSDSGTERLTSVKPAKRACQRKR